MKPTNKNASQNIAPQKFDITNKADVKNIASVANRLLKGIDNETTAVMKLLKSNNERIGKMADSLDKLSKVFSTVTNAAITNTTSTVAKATDKIVEKSNSVKAVKQLDKKAPSKSSGKENKVTSISPVTNERPPLKQVIDKILENHGGGPVKSSDIYAEACSGKEKWSRQSFYNALKDNSKYARSGDGAETTYKLVRSVSISEEETESIIKKAESNYLAIANVI